jgi:hypothetical protein
MGKLYIIIDKRTGKKYQFHRETESYMGEEDAPINLAYSSYGCWKTSTLEEINATDGLFHYLIAKFPYLYNEFLEYLLYNLLSDGGYTEIYRNEECRVMQIKNTKAWLEHWFGLDEAEKEFDDLYLLYFIDDAFLEMGNFYLLEDYYKEATYILSEHYAGFFEICLNHQHDYKDHHFFFKKTKIDISPEIDYCLKSLKLHPAWENYCEIYYNGQVYYIVKENSYYALYNAHFEEIIGSPLCAEQIYVTPTHQPVVIKSNYTGICDLNTGAIRWGYKGIVDKEMDWMRREGMRIIY